MESIEFIFPLITHSHLLLLLIEPISNQLGRLQMQHLGSRLRKEYRSLLHHNLAVGGGQNSNVFKRALIRSSFLNRTQTSARIFSQSFFKTNDSVPLVVIPFKEDNVRREMSDQPRISIKFSSPPQLILQFQKCPKYDEARDYLLANPPKEVLELLNKHSKKLQMYSRRSGRKLNSIADANFLFDAFFCEEQYNLTQPEWVKEMREEERMEIMEMHMNLFTWTEEMKQAKAGPLVTEIVEHLFEAIEHKNLENIFIYAGHDLTLSTVTRTLGLDQQVPQLMELASALAFELHLLEEVPMVKVRELFRIHSRSNSEFSCRFAGSDPMDRVRTCSWRIVVSCAP